MTLNTKPPAPRGADFKALYRQLEAALVEIGRIDNVSTMLETCLENLLARFEDELGTLAEGLVIMSRDEPGIDPEFEHAIGVGSTFAAIAVGRDATRVINLKLEQLRVSGIIEESRIIQESTELDRGGTVLGPLPGARYETATVELAPGDMIVMYTDGIIERENPLKEYYGTARLERLLGGLGEASAREIVMTILAAVDAFGEAAPARDDMTVLVVRKT